MWYIADMMTHCVTTICLQIVDKSIPLNTKQVNSFLNLEWLGYVMTIPHEGPCLQEHEKQAWIFYW